MIWFGWCCVDFWFRFGLGGLVLGWVVWVARALVSVLWVLWYGFLIYGGLGGRFGGAWRLVLDLIAGLPA